MFDLHYFFNALIKTACMLGMTLKITFISAVFALLIGMIVSVARFYRLRGIEGVLRVYLSIFRSTPLMPQLFLFYFGFATVSRTVRAMDALTAACLILSLHQGAYVAETLRGALLSVDEGQQEAALTLGFGKLAMMRHIVFPQAFRVALPALFNDFVNLLKMSSVVFVVGVTDMMGQAKIMAGNSGRNFEVYLAAMVVYWCVVNVMNRFQKFLEGRCAQPYGGV